MKPETTNAKLSIDGQWGAIPRGMAKLLDAPHFKTYAALAFFADAGTRQCYPSMTGLAKETGSNRATVKAHIRTLCAVGAITKLRTGGYRAEGRNEANRYRINDCAAVLAATGLTEAMLDTVKPADISWVVKARAGCEVPQRCPSESSLPTEQRGKAEAYRLALKGVGVPKTPTVGVPKTPTVGVPETPTVGVPEAYITEHITDHTTDHLTEQSVTADTISLIEDSYGAEGESITAHLEPNGPLGSEEDVYMPAVSHTPEGRDSAQADITSPAADTQSVPVNSTSAADESEPLAPAVTANAAQSVKPAGKKKGYRSTVTPPQEMLDALESFPSHNCGQLIHHVLKYSDHWRCVDILRSDDVGIAISDAEKQALLDGYAVEIETAPHWALYVCEDIGLPLSAKELSAA